MSYELLHEIILLLEKFENENESKNYDITTFTKWLLIDRSPDRQNTNQLFIGHDIAAESPTSEIEIIQNISHLIKIGWLEKQDLGGDHLNSMKLSEKAVAELQACFSNMRSQTHAQSLTNSEQNLLLKLFQLNTDQI